MPAYRYKSIVIAQSPFPPSLPPFPLSPVKILRDFCVRGGKKWGGAGTFPVPPAAAWFRSTERDGGAYYGTCSFFRRQVPRHRERGRSILHTWRSATSAHLSLFSDTRHRRGPDCGVNVLRDGDGSEPWYFFWPHTHSRPSGKPRSEAICSHSLSLGFGIISPLYHLLPPLRIYPPVTSLQ